MGKIFNKLFSKKRYETLFPEDTVKMDFFEYFIKEREL